MVQVMIYKALGWRQPQFSHVSLILAPDKSKLSKRHGATSLGEFRQQGFLPQAMLNFLALLGWNDGTEKEIFTLQDLQVIACSKLFDVQTCSPVHVTCAPRCQYKNKLYSLLDSFRRCRKTAARAVAVM